jgi:hypothetical protein
MMMALTKEGWCEAREGCTEQAGHCRRANSDDVASSQDLCVRREGASLRTSSVFERGQ